MLKYVGGILRQFVTSEDGVSQQAILPVAWVAAVMMAAAVVVSMPEKAQAGTCWTGNCAGQHAYYCKDICDDVCSATAWSCKTYPGTLQKKCFCSN